PISQGLRGKTPPDARAAILAPVQSRERRVAAPESRLGQGSSDPPGPPPAARSTPGALRPAPPGKKRGRRRGPERHARAAVRPAAGAVAAPVEAVYERARSAPAAGVDATGWREGKQRARLRAAVTAEATAFRIDRSRGPPPCPRRSATRSARRPSATDSRPAP